MGVSLIVLIQSSSCGQELLLLLPWLGPALLLEPLLQLIPHRRLFRHVQPTERHPNSQQWLQQSDRDDTKLTPLP